MITTEEKEPIIITECVIIVYVCLPNLDNYFIHILLFFYPFYNSKKNS